MTAIIEKLDAAAAEGVTLLTLIEEDCTRRTIVVTFLALLELARLRLIKLLQVSSSETIRVYRNEDSRADSDEIEET